MTVYGFHASHEQFPPSELLRLVEAAQAAGFTRAMCSDQFTPFSAEQGHSGFAWSWLGAAMARTTLPLGVVVFAGAGVCLVLRLLAMVLDWRAPLPHGPANV